MSRFYGGRLYLLRYLNNLGLPDLFPEAFFINSKNKLKQLTDESLR